MCRLFHLKWREKKCVTFSNSLNFSQTRVLNICHGMFIGLEALTQNSGTYLLTYLLTYLRQAAPDALLDVLTMIEWHFCGLY